MKHRKLFCEISSLCYEISVFKCCMLRRLQDLFSKEHFFRKRSAELLPVMIYKHKSLIRRQLGDVDMTLQNNKAVNLSLAAPKISGVLIRPGETFSLWHLMGKTSDRKGYKEGLMIKRGKPERGIGGGLCQLSNLILWIVLHTPFEITERPLAVKYHIESRNEYFTQENGIWYLNGEVWRQCVDKSSGKIIEEKLIKTNHAKVMYDEKYIPMEKQK